MSRWSDDLEDEYLKRQTKEDVGQHRRKIATSNYPDSGVNYMESDLMGPSETAYTGGDPVPPHWMPEDDEPDYNAGAGTTGGYNYSYPSVPTYNYVPGTFNYEYGYKPTEFTGQYGYTPTQFQYKSQYADLINAARDKLHNWNYDPNSDVSYNAYKNQYVRLGDKAMTDALARYATRTGGVANSYAAAAAQQQYNNYMSQLAAKVPELEQLAYNRAQIELNDYLNAEQTDYNRAFNEYSDWENRQRTQADTEYNNAWNEYVDWENRQRTAADTDYDIAYQKWQLEENAREAAAQNAYNNAMAQYNAQVSQINAANRGTGGGTKGSTGTGVEETDDKAFNNWVKTVESQVKSYKDPAEALKYVNSLKSNGYFKGHESTYQQIVDTYGLNGSKINNNNNNTKDEAWENEKKTITAYVKSNATKDPKGTVQYLAGLLSTFNSHDDDAAFNALIRDYNLGSAYDQYLYYLENGNPLLNIGNSILNWLKGGAKQNQ